MSRAARELVKRSRAGRESVKRFRAVWELVKRFRAVRESVKGSGGYTGVGQEEGVSISL